MHAFAKDGDSNVLATPHILATDNIPAEISIGQNIPLQTNVQGLGSLLGSSGGAAGALGALGGLGGLGALGGQAQRQDVGTKIKVTPHVNDSDQVRLELNEEISEAGAAQGSLGAIPINKRTASTTLIVRDQQTVVIGGLVRDSIVNGETKIPILGDIPVLGLSSRAPRRPSRRPTCSSCSRPTSSAIRTICAPSSSARCKSGKSSSIVTSSSTTPRSGNLRTISAAPTASWRTSARR